MSRPLGLSVLGFVLLGVAWMFSTPLLQAPDEASHYLRALTLANGQLLGRRPELGAYGGHSAAAERVRWVARDLRQVSVPASLSPPDEVCLNGKPDSSGTCIEESYTGDYFPLAYLLPAVGIASAHDWSTAMWLARAASLVGVLAFIALALILTRPASRWATVGLMAAITPTVLYIGSVMNPSGMQLAANLAFIAALLRLRRDGREFPAWAWAGLAVSGVATILAWQLGPVFALLDIVACLALLGVDGLQGLWSGRRRHVLAAASILIVATVVFVIWGLDSGVLHSSVSFASGLNALPAGYAQLTPTLKGAVGDFGLYNLILPAAILWIWWLGVLALVAGGLWRSRAGDRVVLGLVTVGGIAFPIVFFAYGYQSSGFGLQARYVLPALALIPMVAGHVIDSGLDRPRRRAVATAGAGAGGWAARLCIAGLAILQLYAWWWNAHQWSGTNTLVLHAALWSPPGGWAPWLAAAVLGGVALLASATFGPTPGSAGSSGRRRPLGG